ncbi:MAG: PQQ-like beta-propeller repeat protein [Bacteroidales bacterium]|nr:PQQ-like beta-propeller repeat protein [Bacteroidales bacterium]
MKHKISLLVCACVLSAGLTGCMKDGENSGVTITSQDETLAGIVVTAGDQTTPLYKLFVVNEGQMGTNNASVDFLRFKDGKYVLNSYSQMNDGAALGDVANDCKIYLNSVWVPVTNSGILEVFSAVNEIKIASITIPSPRNVAFYGSYAYVTSYAGAVYGGENRLGALYKVDLNNGQTAGNIEVGYQPEGIAAGENGHLYVANSGGYTAGYDNRLSIINATTFSVEKDIEVAPNLKEVFYDYDNDLVWVTSMGNFNDVHSGIYAINALNGTLLANDEDLAAVRYSCATFPYDGYLYVIGNDNEYDWTGEPAYNLYKINSSTRTVEKKVSFSTSEFGDNHIAPYGICVNPLDGTIYISDAGDYKTPGKVVCYDKNLNFQWETNTGVCPGHMALYALVY